MMESFNATQPIYRIKPFPSFADPRSGYYTTTEDFETACETDADDESSNAIAAGLPKPYGRRR